jgi:1-aminocyclopropane-1-carboxylate deaminase/D-cysteine desulfhydrase-like pyridoxal-dependent ACC family enzyme
MSLSENFPKALGGSEVRQFYFGAALEQNADTVLITSAVQSNFVRMTAAATRKLGMQRAFLNTRDK